MSFPGTGKIWMNGKLVEWKDATIHIGSHVIHYGSGVFEGARCYATPKGSACFRLDEHLHAPAELGQDLPHGVSAGSRRLARRRARDDSRQPDEGVLHPAAHLPRLRHARRQPAAQPGRRRDLVWEWGAYLGQDALESGVDMKISTLGAHGAEHAAGHGEGDGELRQLGADQDGSARRRLLRRASRSTCPATSAKAAARTSSSCATA